MKVSVRDYNNWLKDFPKSDQKKFRELLNEDIEIGAINKIIKLDKINSDDEYRLLIEYLNDNENLDDINVVNKLNEILVNYKKSR